MSGAAIKGPTTPANVVARRMEIDPYGYAHECASLAGQLACGDAP
jgi:hypothetical protein